MRAGLNWAGKAAVLFCLGYFLYVFVTHFSEIPASVFGTDLILASVIGVVLYQLAAAVHSVVVHLTLKALGTKSNLRTTSIILFLSQIGKYIPGNVAHYLGRIALARRYGYTAAHVTFSIGYEVIWTIVTAVAFAAAAFLYVGPSIISAAPALPPVWVIGLLPAALLIAPVIVTRLLNSWRPAILRRLLGDADIGLPSPLVAGQCIAGTAVNISINAVTFLIMLNQLVTVNLHAATLITLVFVSAWLLGFLFPGAPAGLGVREAVLIAVLGPEFGVAEIALAALLHRIVNIAGNGVTFGIGWVLQRGG